MSGPQRLWALCASYWLLLYIMHVSLLSPMRTCRWLFKRLPGFTSLICDTECCSRYYLLLDPIWPRSVEDIDDIFDHDKRSIAREATTWLMTQLPFLTKRNASKMGLHMAITSGEPLDMFELRSFMSLTFQQQHAFEA